MAEDKSAVSGDAIAEQTSESDEYIQSLMEQIDQNDRSAAYRALELFCESVRLGQIPHKELVQHVADRIQKIYGWPIFQTEGDSETVEEGYVADPRTVFPRPPKRKRTQQKHLDLALAVEKLKAAGVPEMSAIKSIADESNVSEGTAKAAYQEHRKYVQYRLKNLPRK